MVDINEIDSLRDEIENNKTILNRLQTQQSLLLMECNNLDSWRKGRGFGLICMLIICVILVLVLYPYSRIYLDASNSNVFGGKDAVNMSISITALTFGGILLFIAIIFTIILALKTLAEVGNSLFARSLARRFGLKNYYACKEKLTSKVVLDKEIFELEIKLKLDKERLETLLGYSKLNE